MTEVQNKILAYLVDNANTDNEITINNSELAKACDVNLKTIQKFQKDSVADGILQFEKGKYIINENVNVDYTYLVSKPLKDKDLTLTPNEKKVLGFITKMCEEFSEFDFTSISYDNITDNCKITIPTAIRIVKKLIAKSLIAYEQGDYKKKIANKYKVLFPTVNKDNNTANNTNDNSSNNTNNITVNIPDTNPILHQILNKLDKMEQDYSKLHDSLILQAERYRKIEGVAEMLLNYIDELEHDLDNMYVVNNVQRPKPQCRCNIQDIRKYLD